MKKGIFTLSALVALTALTACSLDHKDSALEEASYRAAGFEKNNRAQINATQVNDPAARIENRVESVPGVRNASVLFYGVDNLVIAIDTTGPAHRTVIDARIRQELQGEAKDYLIYVVDESYPDLSARITTTRNQIQKGQGVSDQELTDLMNRVWSSIIPFNFLSKT